MNFPITSPSIIIYEKDDPINKIVKSIDVENYTQKIDNKDNHGGNNY